MNKKVFDDIIRTFYRSEDYWCFVDYKTRVDKDDKCDETYVVSFSVESLCECGLTHYEKFDNYMQKCGFNTHLYFLPKNKKKIKIEIDCSHRELKVDGS